MEMGTGVSLNAVRKSSPRRAAISAVPCSREISRVPLTKDLPARIFSKEAASASLTSVLRTTETVMFSRK